MDSKTFHEWVTKRADELIQERRVICSCGSPVGGHAPDCDWIIGTADAWKDAESEAWPYRNHLQGCQCEGCKH